jgi:hypothetical protein
MSSPIATAEWKSRCGGTVGVWANQRYVMIGTDKKVSYTTALIAKKKEEKKSRVK